MLPVADAPWGLVVLGAIFAWAFVSLARSLVDFFRACRGQHVAQLAAALQRSHVQSVQVEALRAQFALLCDEARDHIAVLNAFREGWDLDLCPVGEPPGRHACDTNTTAIPQVPPLPGLKAF